MKERNWLQTNNVAKAYGNVTTSIIQDIIVSIFMIIKNMNNLNIVLFRKS